MTTPTPSMSSAMSPVSYTHLDVYKRQPLVEAIQELKQQDGKDIIAYGGAGFVTSLIENSLIDELNLFINPTAVGEGLTIFSGKTSLELDNSTRYGCGIVVNKYVPVK